MTPDLISLIRVLSEGSVQYIIVGGVAAGVHGALRPTLDLDVVYARDRDNVARLVAALAPGALPCVTWRARRMIRERRVQIERIVLAQLHPPQRHPRTSPDPRR